MAKIKVRRKEWDWYILGPRWMEGRVLTQESGDRVQGRRLGYSGKSGFSLQVLGTQVRDSVCTTFIPVHFIAYLFESWDTFNHPALRVNDKYMDGRESVCMGGGEVGAVLPSPPLHLNVFLLFYPGWASSLLLCVAVTQGWEDGRRAAQQVLGHCLLGFQ